MNARFKLVHFVSDPFLRSRIPIAALVECNGVVSLVKASHIPGPACLGGRARSATVQMILERLANVHEFEQLPKGFGPQAVLDQAIDVPSTIEDAPRWVQSLLTIEQPSGASEEKNYRGPNLNTFGYRFFESCNVAKYVQKTFHPGINAGGALSSAKPLGPIAHYVTGREQLLLMEPILPQRHSVDEDVQAVARLLGGYKLALQSESSKERAAVHLMAYILAGGSEDKRHEIRSTLSTFADEIVDTSNPSMRARFVERVREVGKTGTPELIDG